MSLLSHPTPLLLALLLVAGALTATDSHADQTRIEVIELHGRSAEELIPLLRPLVQPDGAITGTGYRLIVRGSAAQRREIHRLLEQLDKPPQRLLISVHMGQLQQSAQQDSGVGVRLGGGDVGVAAGEAPADDGVRIRHHDTRGLRDASQGQQVQTLEGEPAFIASGGERLFPTRVETWQDPHGGSGGAVELTTRRATSGFYALARLRGDQVVVRISPQRESFDPRHPGAVSGQRIETTVSGPLGVWLPLGGSGARSGERSRGLGHAASTATLQTEPMWLKVDRLP